MLQDIVPWVENNDDDTAVLTYRIGEGHVREYLRLVIEMASTSKYHRYTGYDDMRWLVYAVNPPYDE